MDVENDVSFLERNPLAINIGIELLKGPRSIAELALRLKKHKVSIRRVIRKLQSLGHCRAIPDDSGREWQYQLTDRVKLALFLVHRQLSIRALHVLAVIREEESSLVENSAAEDCSAQVRASHELPSGLRNASPNREING